MALKLQGKNFNKDNLVKNMVLNHKLVTHLDRAIAKFDEPWEFKYEPKQDDDAWHPSGHCTPSLHELWLHAQHREVEDISPSLRKTFMVGHFYHQYLQHVVLHKLGFAHEHSIERRGAKVWQWLDSADPDVASLPKPWNWATGSADIAPCKIPHHGLFVVDFKTMNTLDYKRNHPPERFADKWECQLNVYMDWFDLERGLVVAVQKDSPHEMKEFEYRRNEPLIAAIYEKWNIVAQCLDEGIEPPADEEFPLPLVGPVE